jgi:DNA-binding XRE family transcriptional regulator
MQVVVKTPHIEINSDNEIPEELIRFLRKKYKNIDIISNEPVYEITESDWYKNISNKMNASSYIKAYRAKKGYTQEQLGELLHIDRHVVSMIETGKRPVSKDMAKRLAAVFETNIEKFID